MALRKNDMPSSKPPHWFQDHIDDDKRRFDAIQASLTDIQKSVKPMADTFATAERLGRWLKIALGVILLVLSIVAASKSITGK
jgi:hypothetical protein